MESPFRSEAAAFRFLLIAIGVVALIVAASWISPWLGTLVAIALVVAGFAVYMRQRGPQAPQQRLEHVGSPDERRVLVVANETVGGEELMQAIGDLALASQAEFFVVCPALNSRLKTWTSDEDGARAAAQKRLDATISRLASIGIEARGTVGDLDPLVAIEDSVRTFHPDEIVLSTHPPGRSHWLERGVVQAVRDRYDVPLTHVVVDLGAAAAKEETPASGPT